jgi:hypothetical protein
MCQSFRVAEIEGYILISKLVSKYRWKTKEKVDAYVELFIKPETSPDIIWERL